MNLHSIESFAKKRIPLYGEHFKYEEKVKKIKLRINVLNHIKTNFEEELRTGGKYKKSKFKVITRSRKEELAIRIQSLDQRIAKLQKKIKREGMESSMAMVGQATGILSDGIMPGSGILVSGASAGIRTIHHNYQLVDNKDAPKNVLLETGKAMASSTLGKVVGVVKDYLI